MFRCYLCKAQALTEHVHSKVLLTKFWSVALSEQSCCVLNVCCKARQRCESIQVEFEFVGNLFLFHIIVGKVISSEFKNVQVGVTMFPTSGPCHCHQNSLSSSSLMSSQWISTIQQVPVNLNFNSKKVYFHAIQVHYQVMMIFSTVVRWTLFLKTKQKLLILSPKIIQNQLKM